MVGREEGEKEGSERNDKMKLRFNAPPPRAREQLELDP